MPLPKAGHYVLAADLTWTGASFEPGVRVEVGADGRIAGVERSAPGAAESAPELEPVRLTGRALLPGMVDAHSHAFQRGLRGRGETFPAGAGSFWTWREAMYGLVDGLDAGAFRRLCERAFREMRAAGITAVGEFHYLHHAGEREDYGLDELVLGAAGEAGIRLVLLNAYYRTGAIGQPLAGAQRRFGSPSPAAYWQQMDRLAERLDRRRQSLGAVVHSIRAASLEDLAAIYGEARRRDLVFHMHVEEQRREIEDAMAHYGKRPMQLLWETLGTATDLTAVHCTHTLPEDIERFAAAGGTVCLCPLTEANLGDGIADAAHMLGTEAGLCLGSDSNARISLFEEMRWLEYGQRLRRESRGVLRDPAGGVAKVLFQAATAGGANALGIPAGRIEPGRWADFAAVDLAAPTLEGWTADTLLDALVFGTTEEVVAATCVGGEWQEHRTGKV
ncbi:MAG TPA: formimidoylglutamate deiminase [Thermoanaerobaculia bacterium]|nr:formimidoylglutamate deiminase [Thermoanaerobaculia bacterium]